MNIQEIIKKKYPDLKANIDYKWKGGEGETDGFKEFTLWPESLEKPTLAELQTSQEKIVKKNELKVLQTQAEKEIERVIKLYQMTPETIHGWANEPSSLLRPIAVKLQRWRTERVNSMIMLESEILSGNRNISEISFEDEWVEFNAAII